MEDVGDLAEGNGARADVTETLLDWELFFLADPEGLIELPAGLEDTNLRTKTARCRSCRLR